MKVMNNSFGKNILRSCMPGLKRRLWQIGSQRRLQRKMGYDPYRQSQKGLRPTSTVSKRATTPTTITKGLWPTPYNHKLGFHPHLQSKIGQPPTLYNHKLGYHPHLQLQIGLPPTLTIIISASTTIITKRATTHFDSLKKGYGPNRQSQKGYDPQRQSKYNEP